MYDKSIRVNVYIFRSHFESSIMRNEYAYIQTHFHILFALRIAEFFIFFSTSHLSSAFHSSSSFSYSSSSYPYSHFSSSFPFSPPLSSSPSPSSPFPWSPLFQKFFESKFWHGLDERAAHSSARAQNQRILCGKKLAARQAGKPKFRQFFSAKNVHICFGIKGKTFIWSYYLNLYNLFTMQKVQRENVRKSYLLVLGKCWWYEKELLRTERKMDRQDD